jgi:putative spermidine/putrescine transport system substrate-binding protein
MRKRKWISLLAALAIVGIGAGCGSDDSGPSSAEPITEIGEGEGAVSIVAWAGYIEDGSNDKNYDWVTKFESDTGCKVSVKVAGTSDEMVSLMTGSKSFDLVTASGDASLRLIQGGTVQPVNLDLIPSYDTVDERLQDAPWYTVDGQAYGVPYDWGANVLMYNKNVFKTPPTSWDVVFKEQKLPDGKSNKGRVQAYDGAIYIADAALYLKAHEPDLGIGDPYALNQEQFDAAVQLLEDQRGLVNTYWHDTAAQIDDFTSGGSVASSSWPYQVNALVLDKQPISSVVPEEGATGWADTTMLRTDAPHPNCAYKWMEWSLNKKVQGDVASWFGSVPAVPAACEGNELLGPDGCKTNGSDDFEEIEFWKTPTADCFGDGGECVPYSEWSTEYQRIKAS